jgi:hypothetical protein
MLHNDQFKKFENEFLHRINTWEYIFGEGSPALEFVQDSFKELGEKVVVNYIYDILYNNIDNSFITENILYIIFNIKFIYILPYVDNMFSSIRYHYSTNLIIMDLLVRCCEKWNTAFMISDLDILIEKATDSDLIKFATEVKTNIISTDQTEMNYKLFFIALTKIYPRKTELEIKEYFNNQNEIKTCFNLLVGSCSPFEIWQDLNDCTFRIIYHKNKYETIEFKKTDNIFDAILNADELIYFVVRSRCCYR